ncbi:MAG: metallophosphoesterase family protein [Haloferula sp.]
MKTSRRSFLTQSGLAATAGLWPARWCRADDLPADRKIKLRFAIASDLHYGQAGTPFAEMADEMVEWINREKEDKGLDLLFINGDLSQDNPQALLDLRDKHLKQLRVPYFTIKGNHDFLDATAGSPAETWEKIWGYGSNHIERRKEFVFVMADTSAPANSSTYLAADLEWLEKEFAKHATAPAIFAFIHIQQRAHKVDGWPAHGVHDKEQRIKAEAVMDLLESTPNVRGVFHGHNHNETGMWESGERRYFFDSHVGGSWGAARGYRIVEIDDENRMVTYQVNAEEDLELNRNDLPQTAAPSPQP